MKGYAKVSVTKEHRNKIEVLVEDIESDKKELQELYDSTKNYFVTQEGFFKKRAVYDALSHHQNLRSELGSEFVSVDLFSIYFYKSLVITESETAIGINKIASLSVTHDEIYLDDELLKVWHEKIAN